MRQLADRNKLSEFLSLKPLFKKKEKNLIIEKKIYIYI